MTNSCKKLRRISLIISWNEAILPISIEDVVRSPDIATPKAVNDSLLNHESSRLKAHCTELTFECGNSLE
jgi:hypothetical protein